jgi:hypothetical protein
MSALGNVFVYPFASRMVTRSLRSSIRTPRYVVPVFSVITSSVSARARDDTNRAARRTATLHFQPVQRGRERVEPRLLDSRELTGLGPVRNLLACC